MSWRTGFLISMALNIVIVGAVLGFVLGGGLQRQRGVGAMILGEPREVAAALPADVRQALRRDLVRAWFETDEERAAWRTANVEVARQLEAEAYDVAAMREALRRQREAGAAAMAKFQDELAESLASLTPEQRRAAAQALGRVRMRAGGAQDGPEGAAPEREAEEPRWREKMRERREQRAN